MRRRDRRRSVDRMTMTLPPAATAADLLTDEMLERFDARAPGYDRDNRFFEEDFAELRQSGYLHAPLPASYGGLGLDLGGRQPPPAPAGVRRAGHRRRRQHAPLLGRARRRPAPRRRPLVRLDPRAGGGRPHPRRRPRRGGQRPAGPAVQLVGHPRRRRLGDQRAQDLRQPLAGVDLPRRARHGHQRPGQPAGRPRVRAPGLAARAHRGDVGHARHARHAVARHDPRPHVHPGRRRSSSSRPPASPVPACTRSPSSPGRCSASPASTAASPTGRSTRSWPSSRSASSVALTRSMAYHPGIQHQIAEMRIRLEAIDAYLDRCATTGRPASTTAWPGR